MFVAQMFTTQASAAQTRIMQTFMRLLEKSNKPAPSQCRKT
jgi:hypothetical protein